MGDHKPFCQGNHICVVYRTPAEHVDVASQFVAEGLAQASTSDQPEYVAASKLRAS